MEVSGFDGNKVVREEINYNAVKEPKDNDEIVLHQLDFILFYK